MVMYLGNEYGGYGGYGDAGLYYPRRRYTFYGGDAGLYQPTSPLAGSQPLPPVPGGATPAPAGPAPSLPPTPVPQGAAGTQTTKKKQMFGPIGTASAPQGGGG